MLFQSTRFEPFRRAVSLHLVKLAGLLGVRARDSMDQAKGRDIWGSWHKAPDDTVQASDMQHEGVGHEGTSFSSAVERILGMECGLQHG